MKTHYRFTLFLLITLFFVKCTNEDDNINYIKINGKTYPLKYGYIEDNGTDVNIKYRILDIELRDKEINPSTYIQFRIFSQSTKKLEPGNYIYSYYATKAGEFTFLSSGCNIAYDNKNIRISGNVYNENYWDFEGNIIISLDKYNNYTFDILIKGYSLETTDSVEIEASFNKNLLEDIVILDCEK